MERDYIENKEPKMRTDQFATYYEVPIVARSRSYQQPISEAIEQTREALRQRKIRNG